MIQARIPILTLVCALCLIAAPTGGHLAAQSAPDTCWVEGYLFGNDMRPARLRTIEIRKVVKAGYLFTFGTAKPQTDTSGFVRFPVPRGSTAYLYADLPGLRTTLPDGVALAIPNTPTARIETLVPASPVPSSYVVAVPPQRYRVLEDGTLKADTIHTLDVSGAIVTSPSPGTAHLQITGGSVVAYGDSIHVADSLARMRRVFISRLSAAITLDSSTDAAGRIYYTVSVHADTVQAWLRDSSMTWMLGRVVQLADSGIAERGYMTPTQIRTLLAGYSVSGHAHAIADVTGLATALGDTASYRDRMTKVEGSLAVILDTINAVRGRLTSVVSDLNAHISTGDAHLPSQTGHGGKALYTNGSVSGWQSVPSPDLSAYATVTQLTDSLIAVYAASGRKIPLSRIDTEVDPTATAKAQAVIVDTLKTRFTDGPGGISVQGRIYVGTDSLVLTALNDTLDASQGNQWRCTIARNDTIYIKNLQDGQQLQIKATQTGTYTLVLAGVKWSGGMHPTLTATAGRKDVYTLMRNDIDVIGAHLPDAR